LQPDPVPSPEQSRSSTSLSSIHAILNRGWLLRWVYISRLSLASAIFIAAVLMWKHADSTATLLASLAFAVTTAVTVVSAGYSEIYQRPLNSTFLYLQTIYDLVLVTVVVHITYTLGSSSQFSALYILVIAAASLLLPAGGGLLIAALGNVMYFADVVWFLHFDWSVMLQLSVFAVVALGSAILARQLREQGEGSDRLAAELEHTRMRAEDILDNIRSGVVTVDAQGRLIFANPTAADLLNLDLHALTGLPVLQALASASPELAAAVQRAAQHRERTTRGEGSVITDRRRFPIGVTTTYTDDAADGRLRSATAIFQDISDHKRMEALRLRAQRLEGVAELSASLAHEIKNPLASIRSAVEQIGRMPQATGDQRTLSHLVMRESDRLSRLLSEFLDFARVHVATTTAVNLHDIARGAVALANTHPDRPASVEVVCRMAERTSGAAPAAIHVDGDQDLLHRAVFNLVLNAVQASPADSRVLVEVTDGSFERLPASVAFDHGAVSLRVSDEGSGISADIRDRLFDPFFTTKPQGSGLGLAVVHRAIEAHKGLVFVDSGPRGTRFTVVLPRAARTSDTPGAGAQREILSRPAPASQPLSV
jgi:two-component system sensor histidine kinase PilS (NtrC family)